MTRSTKRSLINIFIVVFLDLLGFGLILPLLPYYAADFNATPTLVGLLTASYAAAQLIGAPILGRMSDQFGRRPILLLSILGTALSLVMLGFAEPLGISLSSAVGLPVAGVTLTVLFVSRILDGLTGGNISVAQAYIADVTDEKSRAMGLGLIGAAFGLGFIAGPALGALLSDIPALTPVLAQYGLSRYAVPAFVAAFLSFMNLLGVLISLPESLTAEKRSQMAARHRPAMSLGDLLAAFTRPLVGPLLHTRFFFGVAFAMFQTIFPLYSQYQLGLDARGTGFILTYVGMLSVLVQGVGVAQLTKRFAEDRLVLFSVGLMSVGLLGWAFTPTWQVLLVVLAPVALAGGVLNTVLSSLLSKSVAPDEIGGILGINASVESATRTIAPSLGGVLLGQLGSAAPGIFGALITASLVPFVWRKVVRRAENAGELVGVGD